MMQDIISEECKDFPVTKAHALLGICDSQSNPKDTRLLDRIRGIVEEYPRYGYRRVTRELHRQNHRVNHKRVLATMRQNGLKCKKKRFRVCTTDSNHNNMIYPNLTMGINVDDLNQVWSADITYVHLAYGGICYLATILDRHSRKCIGWQLSRNIDTQLCIDALDMALDERSGIDFAGIIHHSDRGSQYASNEYTAALEDRGIMISMSRKGNPYDNAHAESFFKTVKYEEVYMNEYCSFADAYHDIGRFIEEVYNKKRLHSAIGYMPPAEFEQKILNEVGA